ncbi:O-antigen polymerase [Hydrotalea sp.]|uniref:O-antigen polymerase n=1 Tax=Hydrotalea sp. TaxID=2881279 RepID=UPI003D0CE61B
MNIFINLLVLIIFQIGTYFIWFDKKNVFNHYYIGFCIAAYVIPSFLIDFYDLADDNIIDLYYKINFVGVLFYIFGILSGYKWKKIAIVDNVMKFRLYNDLVNSNFFYKTIVNTSKQIYLISLIILIICFMYMGFLPIFAEDPYAAKQFKGIYHVRYQHIAFFYRTSKEFIQLLIPILVIDFFNKRKISTFFLIIFGILLVFASLSRGDTVMGLLLSLSIIVTMRRNNSFFVVYIILYVIMFLFGSSFWVIATIFFPNTGFNSLSDNPTILSAIASGAPDIYDHITFLNSFIREHSPFTYGLTFIGGLIPYNFKYNPSSWTLYILNNTNDISDIASGGLRLPVSIWGYVSFGWFGVVLVPFFSAFFTGYIIRKIKYLIYKLKPDANGLIAFYYYVFLYLNIGSIFFQFYRISIYMFPSLFFYFLIIYFIKKKKAIL